MRTERDKGGGSFPAVTGASSLLVIFSVLCLTVFALLSLSTVSADHRIAERNTQALQAHYAAELQANEILAQLREGRMPQGVRTSLSHQVPGHTGEQLTVCEYSCKVSDTTNLEVTVWLSPEKTNSLYDTYTVLRWQEVSTFDWEPDTHIPVYTGE